MRVKIIWRTLIFTLICCVLTHSESLAQRKKQLAVLNFDFSTVDIGIADRAYGGQQNLAIRISDKLITSLLGLGTCQVIERSQLEKILNEQNLGTSGRIDPSTAASIGKILGVDALIIGNVAAFDLKGLPKSSTDSMWDPSDMNAHIAVNFRVVNTTTALVEWSSEVIGVAASAKRVSTGSRVTKSLLGGFLSGRSSRSEERVEVRPEQLRDVLQVALDEAVTKISTEINVYIANGGRVEETKSEATIIGRIIELDGPSVVIADITRSLVRKGDRLFVRRARERKDPQTGKVTRYSVQVGEVEIVEIQDEVVIGSFSGSGSPKVDDIVTNSVSGAGGGAGSTRPPQ